MIINPLDALLTIFGEKPGTKRVNRHLLVNAAGPTLRSRDRGIGVLRN